MLFESLILCDDVRFETNGKLILVGVYSDMIQVAKLPLQMRSLGLAIKAKVMSRGHLSFAVSISDPQGNTLGRIVWLPVVMGPALLTTEGAYSVRITLGESAPVHENFVVRKASMPEVQMTQATPN